MLKITMDYPDTGQELALANRMLGSESPEDVLASGSIKAVIRGDDLAMLRESLQKITVKPEIMEYIVSIVRTTRTHESVLLGAGPRATQAMVLSSRALAALSGRDFVTPDDVKMMSVPVLEHRIILRPEFEIEGHSIPETIKDILKGVTVPR
jgi:MoxR-like ATPase